MSGPSLTIDVPPPELGPDGKPKKAPVALKRVLFGSGEDVDGDGIPDEVPVEDLEAAFKEIDADGSGVIDSDELVEALRACGLNASKAATDVVLKEIDKNLSGDVDINEFIDFFRNLEELGRFQKRSEQRAKFLSFILNCCFLTQIISVGTLIMVFIRMDEAEDPDNYKVMKNLLIATSATLSFLCIVIIMIPVLRLTLGAPAQRAQLFVANKTRPVKLRAPGSQNEDNGPGGPRNSGWGSSGPPPSHLNMAMYGTSYRATKQPLPPAEEAPVIEDQQQGKSRRTTRATLSTGALGDAEHGEGGAANAAPGLQNMSSIYGTYDPEQYRKAQIAALNAQKKPAAFNPMQARNLAMPLDVREVLSPTDHLKTSEQQLPGMPAIEYNPAGAA